MSHRHNNCCCEKKCCCKPVSNCCENNCGNGNGFGGLVAALEMVAAVDLVAGLVSG